MFLDLLHFGDGRQAINYFMLCLFALLGTLQFVALGYHRRDLIWLHGRASVLLSISLIVASFVWFFVTDQEIFIPGLAGGELFTIFILALLLAVPITRLLAFVTSQMMAWQHHPQAMRRLLRRRWATSHPKEKEPLA
jgi:hypothetical protein